MNLNSSTFLKLKSFFNFLIVVLIIFYTEYAFSNNLGVSPIYNFTKKIYKAAPQNWDIAQNADGILYVANSDGLLEFDGTRWRLYKVKNQTIVRAVEIDELNNKIYVGAQGELGYFKKNNQGILNYTSLTHLIKNKVLADVWDIELLNKKVYFRTSQNLYVYDGTNIKTIYSSNQLNFLHKINQTIYLNDLKFGLVPFKNDAPNYNEAISIFKNKFVIGIEEIDSDKKIIATINNGLFIHENSITKPYYLNDKGLLKQHSNSVLKKIDSNRFALGTSTFGTFIFNHKGEILQSINQENGLQVNNVLQIFIDKANNLWLALNNGIDLVETSSAISYIYPQKQNFLTGYSIKILNGKIYFGSSNGVFTADWKQYYNPTENNHFSFVKNSGGQVWNIDAFNNQILVNHHEGTFIIKDNFAYKTDAKVGAWQQIQISEDELLSGSYNGLSILKMKNNTLRLENDFQDQLSESCRILVQDAYNNFWISHPYRGVYKVKIADDYSKLTEIKLYNSKNGFPSDLQIYVFKVHDEIIFTSEDGIFLYNAKNDTFEPNSNWNDIFKDAGVFRRIIEAKNNEIWFVNDKDVGLLRKDVDGKNYKRFINELKDKLVGSFENIYPYDDENVFIPFEKGFVHLNPKKIKSNKNYKTLITSVYNLKMDSLLSIFSDEIPTFKFKENSLAFKYSATNFANAELTNFQYKLEGYDSKWSTLSNKTEIEYTNLNSGSYTFNVKAYNTNKTESNTAKYTFKIKPPWYLSIFAFAIYSCLLSAGILSIVLIPRKRFEKEISQLTSDYLITEEKQKVQITQLENEKLELQLINKNQENLQLKEEKLKAELSVLKEQISPHFFFNTLNTLASIVRTEKKENSLDFIDNISVVYRYLLDSESKNLITIEEELNFLMAYYHLLIKRFGESIKLNISISDKFKQNKIVSMAFQILLENVVKHNKVSKRKVVNVQIIEEGNFICFINNIQKKKVLESTGLGLANLNKRCKILLDENIEVVTADATFKVKIPILKHESNNN